MTWSAFVDFSVTTSEPPHNGAGPVLGHYDVIASCCEEALAGGAPLSTAIQRAVLFAQEVEPPGAIPWSTCTYGVLPANGRRTACA